MTQGQGSFIVVTGFEGDKVALSRRFVDASLWPNLDGRDTLIKADLSFPGSFAAWTPATAFAKDDTGLCLGYFDLLPPADRNLDAARSILAGELIDDHSVPGGSFGYVHLQGPGTLVARSDLFRSVPLFYACTARGMAVASDLRLLGAAGIVGRQVSLPALYHFLNFSYVPTPHTLFEGIQKVPRASIVTLRDNRTAVRRYWTLQYTEDRDTSNIDLAAEELREHARAAILRNRPTNSASWGTFLSGGTDSSSIAGILARAADAPINTFSIGFAEADYDELEFARIAAKHFALNAHTQVVSADETLALIPELLDAYDEPPGNASSIPTLACAKLARDAGMTLLIGGDGGDEIFGGNERYRKDAIMQGFYGLPRPLKALASACTSLGKTVDWRPWNRVKNFVSRSLVPNPDRFYSDDSFASQHYEELLSPHFRAAVGVNDSLELMRERYSNIAAPSELHRIMELDLEMTIADNDIVKVTRACKAARVAVRFPYLDCQLVEYAATLPHRCKVRHGEKRFLFKRAMKDLLPEAILKKKKQGFGLPISIWFRKHARYRELIDGILCGRTLRERGLFDERQIRAIVERHDREAWDHGAQIWYLLMVELWIRKHIDEAR